MAPFLYPNGEFALGLSMSLKSHTAPPPSPETRERKGQKQTAHSKRMVRNAAWLLQKQAGRTNLTFLTATLPDVAVDALEAREDASDLWSEITRQYIQWIRRCLDRAAVPSDIVGCDEVQPHRWRKTGKVALHIHLVFKGRRHHRAKWIIGKQQCLTKWLDIVSNVLDVCVDDNKSATRIERVKRSAEYYLSKYMSKSGHVVDEIIEAGKRYLLPSQWWHCSNRLKFAIKSMCLPVSPDAVDIIYTNREELIAKGIIQWLYVHEIDFIQPHGEVWKVPVAICGKFAKPEYREMFVYQKSSGV